MEEILEAVRELSGRIAKMDERLAAMDGRLVAMDLLFVAMYGCLAAMDGRLFFFQAEDGIRERNVTGVQTCALPISAHRRVPRRQGGPARWRPYQDPGRH